MPALDAADSEPQMRVELTLENCSITGTFEMAADRLCGGMRGSASGDYRIW
jgi:hypothetical protein